MQNHHGFCPAAGQSPQHVLPKSWVRDPPLNNWGVIQLIWLVMQLTLVAVPGCVYFVRRIMRFAFALLPVAIEDGMAQG